MAAIDPVVMAAAAEVLISISSTYRALENPVLRRTVARVATLRQVAKVGGIPLGTLINRLRTEVGQAPMVGGAEEGRFAEIPEWVLNAAVTCTDDARPGIESGGHPMSTVMAELAKLAPDQIFRLITPFEPGPLIDVAKQKGYEAFSVPKAPDWFETYFRRF